MYGEKIRELRSAAGLSQTTFCDKLAEKYGEEFRVTQNAMSKYESEEREPSADFIICIADFFGVSTDYLLLQEKSTPPLIDEVLAQLKTLSKEDMEEALRFAKYLKWREEH